MSQFEEVVFEGKDVNAELNAAMHLMEHQEPARFRRMVTSRSLHTDQHVIDLVSYVLGYDPHYLLLWMEQASYRMARDLWDEHFPRVQKRRAPPMAHMWFRDVLQTLQFQQTIATYKSIFDAKAFLGQDPVVGVRADRMPWVCCILGCQSDGERQMNSMQYCAQHWGLALLYGMRHHCSSCKVFALCGIKHTGGDRGHQYHYLQRMAVPLITEDDRMFNATVKTFCGSDFDPDKCELAHAGQHHGFVYWEPFTGRTESVPEHSFIYVRTHTKQVCAWIHVEVLEEGAWRPVREIPELDYVLSVDKSTVQHNDRNFPCAPYWWDV